MRLLQPGLIYTSVDIANINDQGVRLGSTPGKFRKIDQDFVGIFFRDDVIRLSRGCGHEGNILVLSLFVWGITSVRKNRTYYR